MIDHDLFEKVQLAREQNRTRTGNQTSRARVYWLSGAARCPYCGGPIHVHVNKEGRPRVYCYARAQGAKECATKCTFQDVYEEQIEYHLSRFHIPEDHQAQIIQMEQKLVSAYDDNEAERKRLKGRLARIKDLYGWGDMSKSAYLAEREDLQRHLAALSPLDERGKVLDLLAGFLRDVPDAWRRATQEQRNWLMKNLFEEVLTKDDQAVAVKPRPDFEPFFRLDECQAKSSTGGSDGGSVTHVLSR
ncbi:MAG: recombinase zinc ribbon domain-containing protein [Chloroflexota bacterium]